MFQRKIEEHALNRPQRELDIGLQSLLAPGECQHIACKGLRCVSIDVSRKLVREKDQRKTAQWCHCPRIKFIAGCFLHICGKTLLNQLIDVILFYPPEFCPFLRDNRVVCA